MATNEPMTVRELIAALSKMPPDYMVYMEQIDECTCIPRIGQVRIEYVEHPVELPDGTYATDAAVVLKFVNDSAFGGSVRSTSKPFVKSGQMVDAMEYLVRKRFPEAVARAEADGILPPAPKHIQDILDKEQDTEEEGEK